MDSNDVDFPAETLDAKVRRRLARSAARFPAFLLLGVLLVLDLTASRVAYWTQGNIGEGLHYLATGLMLPIALVAFWFPRAASVAGLVLALILVPNQARLADQWLQASRLAGKMAVRSCEARTSSGQYPASMPASVTTGGVVVKYGTFEDRSRMAITFSFSYGTSHWLMSPSGVWFFEAD